MKILFAGLLAAAGLTAQPYGGFVDAKVRVLGDDELAAPAEVKAWLPLTLVELRGTNWSENRILRHVVRTAAAFGSCGVALGPVTLVEAKTPDGRHDLTMTALDPRTGVPRDVVRVAGLLPREARWPVAFFAGRLVGDEAIARSYGRGEIEPGREPDFPYMSTAWFAYKTHWIERRDEEYSSLAHELAHLLCNCGHVRSKEPHLMNTYRNMLSSHILPEHCGLILESPLLIPVGAAFKPVRH